MQNDIKMTSRELFPPPPCLNPQKHKGEHRSCAGGRAEFLCNEDVWQHPSKVTANLWELAVWEQRRPMGKMPKYSWRDESALLILPASFMCLGFVDLHIAILPSSQLWCRTLSWRSSGFSSFQSYTTRSLLFLCSLSLRGGVFFKPERYILFYSQSCPRITKVAADPKDTCKQICLWAWWTLSSPAVKGWRTPMNTQRVSGSGNLGNLYISPPPLVVTLFSMTTVV